MDVLPDAGVGELFEPVSERDHVLCLPTAPITIVEYGDDECPDSPIS